MMFIIPSAQCDLNLSLKQKSLLCSINFVGAVSSSLLWGYIADVKGRRFVLIISMLVSSLSGFACAFMTNVDVFIVLKFVNGLLWVFIFKMYKWIFKKPLEVDCSLISAGGATAAIFAYLSEFHGLKHRQKVVTILSIFVAVAQIFVSGFAWIILQHDWMHEIPLLGIVFKPWRLLVMT